MIHNQQMNKYKYSNIGESYRKMRGNFWGNLNNIREDK
jgi:hypothetical protein